MRETASEKYRERSGQAGDRLSASPVRVTKCALFKKEIVENIRRHRIWQWR